MAGVILYNLTDPYAEDPQCDGFGIYRTVASGTLGLRELRQKLPIDWPASVTYPDEAERCWVNFTASNAKWRFWPTFCRYSLHLGYRPYLTVQNHAWAYTGYADKEVLEEGLLGSGHGYRVTADALPLNSGYGCMHEWETQHINGVTPVTAQHAHTTYAWEGTDTRQPTATGTTSLPAVNGTRLIADGVSTGWAQFELVFRNDSLVTNLTHPSDLNEPSIIQTHFNTISTLWPKNPFDVLNTDFPDTSGDSNYYFWHTFAWENPAVDTHIQTLLDYFYGSPVAFAGPEDVDNSGGYVASNIWESNFLGLSRPKGISWNYIDTFLDADLGVEVETDNDVPPPGNQISLYQEHFFLSGDPDHKHWLYWSKRFRFEAWPVDNYMEIGTENDPIVTHLATTAVLGVFTHDTKYAITGNDTSGFTANEAMSHRSAPSVRSVVNTPYGVAFVARDGVFITNFISPDVKISDAIDPIFNGINPFGFYTKIDWNYAGNIATGFYKNKLYVSYTQEGFTINNLTLVYSFDTQEWTSFNLGFHSFYSERDTNLFLAGDTVGLVHVIEEASTFDDSDGAIAFDLATQEFTGTAHSSRNLFLYFKVDCDMGTTGVGTAEFYLDDELIASKELTGTRTNELLHLPNESLGHRWFVRVTYTGTERIKVYGVTAFLIPLEGA